MRVLVVGAGIAGLSFAMCASRLGLDVEIVERRATLRTEGYMIDFFGPGFDVAERLGLLPALEAIHYPVERLVFVDERGTPQTSLDYARIRRSVFRDRHFNFMRGELEAALYGAVRDVRLRLGVSPAALVLDASGVTVETTDGERGRFDVVVGADGVHSRVRALVLPPAQTHLRALGCRTAAYVIDSVIEGLPSDAFVTLAAPGKSVAAYPIRGGRTATFFVHRAEGVTADRSAAACRRELDATYRGLGWLVDPLLERFPTENDVYFDDVVQTEVAHWSHGRVALIGDACGCVSLIAGQGASMALAGAYVLAQELARGGNPEAAIARYEARIRPPVERCQRSGRRNAGWFLPKSKLSIFVRDRLTSLAVASPFAPLLGRSLGAHRLSLDG